MASAPPASSAPSSDSDTPAAPAAPSVPDVPPKRKRGCRGGRRVKLAKEMAALRLRSAAPAPSVRRPGPTAAEVDDIVRAGFWALREYKRLQGRPSTAGGDGFRRYFLSGLPPHQVEVILKVAKEEATPLPGSYGAPGAAASSTVRSMARLVPLATSSASAPAPVPALMTLPAPAPTFRAPVTSAVPASSSAPSTASAGSFRPFPAWLAPPTMLEAKLRSPTYRGPFSAPASLGAGFSLRPPGFRAATTRTPWLETPAPALSSAPVPKEKDDDGDV
jgi:hypothetical protein